MDHKTQAERGSNRTEKHNHSSHLWMIFLCVFTARQMSAKTSEKTFPVIVRAKLICSLVCKHWVVEFELAVRLYTYPFPYWYQWWPFYSPWPHSVGMLFSTQKREDVFIQFCRAVSQLFLARFWVHKWIVTATGVQRKAKMGFNCQHILITAIICNAAHHLARWLF